MEDRIAGHSPAEAIAGVAAPVAWRDLRDWLDLVEANGLLKHIASPVEPDEEIGGDHLAGDAPRGCAGPAVRASRRRPLAGPHPVQHARRQQGTLRAGRRYRPRSFDRRDDRGDAWCHEPAHRAGARRQVARRR